MSFLIGLTAGVFGGLVGLGGGVLMIPMMVGILKLNQHKAHGTSLVALVFTGLAGACTYAFHDRVDVSAALVMAAAAFWPARMGAQYSRLLPEIKLKRSFGFLQVAMAILLLLKPYVSPMAVPMTGWLKVLTLLVTGAATGFLSGLMGIGGGAVMITAMVLLVGYGQHIAQGSALLAMAPAGAIGAFTHWRQGQVEVSLVKGLVGGIVLGSILGAGVAQFLPESVLRIVFAAVLIWMGVRSIRAKAPAAK
jgi:uncharacterized membrane protein YfcA